MLLHLRRLLLLLTALPALSSAIHFIPHSAAATETQAVTLKFQAKVGDRPFECGTNYAGLGTPATSLTVSDFRFYISEVALIDANGKAVPLSLVQDGKWQYQNVALLDFENKSGACVNGTVETNAQIVGTVPEGNYTGVRFTLGVPFDLNHADATLAASPLNLTALWWTWRFGYKFARIDLVPMLAAAEIRSQHDQPRSPKPEPAAKGFAIHLGSTGCQVSTVSQKPVSCDHANRSTVTFNRFNLNKNVIVADLAKLVANTDLNRNQPKTSLGCMSEPEDSDCPGIMANFGIPLNGKSANQVFFRAE